MRSRLRCLLPLLTALLLVPSVARAAICITDDAGDRVCLERPATRIVSLYAAFTDIFEAMEQTGRIAGRTKTDLSGTLAATVPVIGTHMRPNMELVLGLRPDLALQMGGRAEAAQSVANLRRHGIPTAFFQVGSFADLFSVITRLGILTGETAAADALVRSLSLRLEALEKALDAIPSRPKVFFEVRYPNLLGAGPYSLVSDIIQAAGGVNVLGSEGPSAGSRKGRVIRLSEEELLRLDPDFYCIQVGPMNKNPAPLADRPHFASLRAVRSGHSLFVDEYLFSRPGPLAVDAAEKLARELHPGIFKEKTE